MLKSFEKKIEKMMNEADVDGEGQINFLEFHEVTKAPTSESFKNQASAPPKPPDGGYGWVIVFACFMCNFIVGRGSKKHFLREWKRHHNRDSASIDGQVLLTPSSDARIKFFAKEVCVCATRWHLKHLAIDYSAASTFPFPI